MTRPSRFSPEVQERAVRMVLEHGEQYWAPYGVGHTKARTGHQAYGRGQTGPPSIYPAELVPAPRRISYALDATRNAPQTGAGRTLGVSWRRLRLHTNVLGTLPARIGRVPFLRTPGELAVLRQLDLPEGPLLFCHQRPTRRAGSLCQRLSQYALQQRA